MKKYIIAIMLAIVLAAAGAAASASPRLGTIEFAGWSGNDAVFHYNVYGAGDHEEKNAHVVFWFPDLGVYDRTRPFGMHDRSPDGKFAYVRMDRAAIRPGLYLARVTLASDTVRDDRWMLVRLA